MTAAEDLDTGAVPQAGRVPWLAPWLLWAVGLVMFFHPTLTSGFQRDQLLPRDPLLVASIFEHTWFWVTGAPHHGDFWSPPIFYPAQQAGGYTDTVVGAAPPYWLARALGARPRLAFQLWTMAALSLAYLGAWLLLRRVLLLGPWPAAVGAFLFGFGSARSAHLSSPQLMACFWGVFALAALGAALRHAGTAPGRTRLWLAVAGACGAAQAWSAFYPTMFLTVVLLAALAVGVALPAPRARLSVLVRRHPLMLLLVMAGTLALVLPLAEGHRAVVDTVGTPSVSKVVERLPTPSSWFDTGRTSLVGTLTAAWGLEPERDAPGHHSNGVGLLTTLLMLLGLWSARRRPAAQVTFAATLVVMLVAARWPGGFSPWAAVYTWLPGAEALRYPMRIGLWLGLTAAVGVGFWCQARLRGGGTGVLAVVLLVPLCLAEQVHVTSTHDARRYDEALDRLAARVDREAAAFYLVTVEDAAPGDPQRDVLVVKPKPSQVLAMWVALTAVHPTVNGTYGRKPSDWDLISNNITGDAKGGSRTRADVEADLMAWCEARGLERDSIQVIEVPWSELPFRFITRGGASEEDDDDQG